METIEGSAGSRAAPPLTVASRTKHVGKAMAHSILIVDDDRSVRQSFRMFLELEGFKVSEASSWVTFQEAFYKAQEPPDVVLFDINLGSTVSGDTLITSLRKSGEHRVSAKRSKFLLLSGLPEREVAERAKKCGADGYLMKGVAVASFVSQLRSFLE
jgi:DNA-binding NarL/FixJ family response regulator